jgi:hypothetical protein
MELMPLELRRRLPPLYAGEERGLSALARVHYFTPDGSWDWYASEFDGADLFFGLVAGHEVELGYFRLSELKGARGQLGLPVERDLWFKPASLAELFETHQARRL